MGSSFNKLPTNPFNGFDIPAVDLPCETAHQLVVLGNGFDLQCGLNSRFSSFFDSRIKAIKELEPLEGTTWVEALRGRGLTAWDLILYTRKSIKDKGFDVNWCDIEAVISDVVQMRGDSDDGRWFDDAWLPSEGWVTVWSICEYFWYLEKHPDADSPIKYAKKREKEFEETEDYSYGDLHHDVFAFLPNPPSEYVGSYLKDAYSEVRGWNEDKVRAVLFDELTLLENEFSRYLIDELHQATTYEDRSRQLLAQIIDVDYDELADEGVAVSVLSFNYTQPGLPTSTEYDLEFSNVHGMLGGEIIFGADGMNCMGDAGAARFSKTYRLMRRGEAALVGAVAYPPNRQVLGGVETVAIKFYGHSLALADYSYFQSMFDAVDLYAGSTRLYFLYRNHTPTAREDLMQNVTRLLDAYGTTMDNRDHGKNLLHKLLLEKRLVVREV